MPDYLLQTLIFSLSLFFFFLTRLPTRTLKMDLFHIVNALPLLSACELHFGTSLLALFVSIEMLDEKENSFL